MTINPTLEKQKWLAWFANLGQAHAEKRFGTWLQLMQKQTHLQTILKTSQLELPEVQADLEIASAKLAYDKPYRVVVIGESGAGKSTLINAVLQRDLLPSETGGAVTGTAVCILPNTSESRDRVKFEWRSDREFVKLLRELASRYKVNLLNNATEAITPQEIFKLLSDNALSPPDDVPDRIRHQLPEELRDIAATWNRLLTGKVNRIPGLDISQKLELDSILMESSELNRDERTRMIPGIKYAEYWLSSHHNAATSEALKHVVLVDTPGVGATILRHYEILQQEVKQADAVILVVGAKRPGAYAEEMAYLIQRVLFDGYSTEASDQFASKVFLVVNQADELLGGRGNRSLLEQSVSRIAQIISPDYEQRYGKTSAHCRYFETMSLLSCLSSQILQGNPLSDEARKLYDSQVSLFGQRADTVHPNQINQLTQIPALTAQLDRFLGEQRIDLTLAEAEYTLRRAEDKLWGQCRDILAKHGLNVERNRSTVDGLHTIYLRQVCQGVLDRADDALKQQQKSLIKAMDQWRTSDLHQRQLSSVLQSIFDDLKTRMEGYLTNLLNPDAREGRIRESRDDAEGRNYLGIVPEEVLLAAQQRFRRTVEDQSYQLVGYYINKLQTEIETHKLYDLLNETCYEQSYTADLDPVGEIERELTRIKTEFESICRWILIYELIKMPILSGPIESGVNTVVQKAFERSIDTVVDSIPNLESLKHQTAQAVSLHLISDPLTSFVDAVAQAASQPPVTEVASDPWFPRAVPDPIPTDACEQTQQFLNLEQLKLEIARLMGEDDREAVAQLIQQQFALRYHLAIGTAIVFLEKLFFYLLEHYRCRLQAISQELIKRHENHLGAGIAEIRDRLLAEHTHQKQEVIQAINCLKQLEKTNQTELNSAHKSQAA